VNRKPTDKQAVAGRRRETGGGRGEVREVSGWVLGSRPRWNVFNHGISVCCLFRRLGHWKSLRECHGSNVEGIVQTAVT
jgi:hypothetical protein